MIVLVQSHRQDRATRKPQPSAPAPGARWGRAARFGFDPSAADAEMEARGGLTLRWPAERIETVRVTDLSPVWRRFDVVRIRSSSDETSTELATLTRAMLIPIGTSNQRYVGGGVRYVEDPGSYGYEDRVIHTFLRLAVPSPVPEAELVETGAEGAWPDCSQEMFPPGRFARAIPAARGLAPMRYADLVRLCAPVIAAPNERRALPADPTPGPESSARWGRPSEFSWSSEAAKAGRNHRETVSAGTRRASRPSTCGSSMPS